MHNHLSAYSLFKESYPYYLGVLDGNIMIEY